MRGRSFEIANVCSWQIVLQNAGSRPFWVDFCRKSRLSHFAKSLFLFRLKSADLGTNGRCRAPNRVLQHNRHKPDVRCTAALGPEADAPFRLPTIESDRGCVKTSTANEHVNRSSPEAPVLRAARAFSSMRGVSRERSCCMLEARHRFYTASSQCCRWVSQGQRVLGKGFKAGSH